MEPWGLGKLGPSVEFYHVLYNEDKRDLVYCVIVKVKLNPGRELLAYNSYLAKVCGMLLCCRSAKQMYSRNIVS